MNININDIKKLIAVMEKSTITRIEISEKDESICISKEAPQIVQPAPTIVSVPQQHQDFSVQTTSQANKDAQNVSSDSKQATEEVSGHQICSPMVGTYYKAPSPDSDVFIKVGQKVEVGDTICIIEAMKMMNEIEADRAGTVRAILVEDASPVEFGQPIVVID